MQKDVIYIDVEDDITAIVSKVKSAKQRVVALVPPKRLGVLQSAVNLRLLDRAAKSVDKRLVLITSTPQLQTLAAAANIPVAKNLQSKPEVIAIASIDDEADDIIDGRELPVGELARTSDLKINDGTEIGDSADTTDQQAAAVAAAPAIKAARKQANAKTRKPAVPDFNRFRKKLVIFGGLGALLIGFLVWAIWFAPRATIVVAARTTESTINTRVNLSSGQATNFEAETIKAIVEETAKQTEVEFEATGEEDRGEKASGQVTLSIRCTDVSSGQPSVPAGTEVSSGGKVFITQSAISMTTPEFGSPCRFSGSGPVVAAENGDDYNLPSGASYAVSGYSDVSGTGSAMTGGVSNVVKIVTAADMHTAREKLVEQNTDAVKAQLAEAFDDKVVVIDSSFVVTPLEPEASVEVGDEAKNGRAKLTSEVRYRLSGVAKDDLDRYLKQALESTISDRDVQQVFETGADKAELTDFQTGESGDSIAISAVGQIGPRIDEDEIKSNSRGQRYGEVQSALESLNGVSEVDVKFWPFWVRTVPNDIDKISVEFKLEGDD